MPDAPRVSLAVLFSILVVSQACVARPPNQSDTLPRLIASYDREVAPYFPFAASERGARQYDRVLANDIGDEYRRGLGQLCARSLERLRRLDREPLTEQHRLTYDIFASRLEHCLERLRFPWHLLPVNQAGGWTTYFPIVGAGQGVHPFKTARNYEDFLGRIDGFVVWIDTAIRNMRLGIERGITQPRDAMLKVIPQLDAHIVDDPRVSVFYEPITKLPKEFDSATRAELEAKYVHAIQLEIVPAYRKLRAFMQDEYLPRCRTSFGLGAIPGGPDMYLYAVRAATTTDLTPEQIYALGIEEVKRIKTEIERLRAEIETAREPAPVRYRSIEDLLSGYASLRSTVEAALPKLFGRLPKARFEVRRIEAFRERSTPSSYEPPSFDGSRPAVFYLNAFELQGGGSAPVSPSLFLHETVPGHHLQLALQRESDELPNFRKFAWYTAFGEGWALYAEGLGQELGVYRSRHDRLDLLNAELLRAARLVVDVGLHAKGWTRVQAIEYLGGRRERAEREVERYMVWPGQALGYKIGQLRIQALRKKAEAALGGSFDVRAFHDELLKDGAMPLRILEAKMDRWIATRQSLRPRVSAP